MMFLVDGVGFGVWAALLPSLQRRLSLGDGELSGVLLVMAAGAMAAMGVVGKVISRFGCRVTLGWLAPAFCVALCAPVLAPNLVTVGISAAVVGALKGSIDVSINSLSISVEKALGRPVISSFQAWWSFGGLGAAGLTGLALRWGSTPVQITFFIVTVLMLISLMAPRHLLDEARIESGRPESSGGFEPRLIWIGILAFSALFVEGVMMDWSAIYSQRVAGAADWLAPLAYGVFSIAMGVGRLLGDRVMGRFEPRTVVRYSGWLGAIGLGIAVIFPYWPATFCGLVAVGLGFSNLVPVFLGAASRVQPHAVAHAVARVSMIGYTGFLAGPPLIGFLSNQIGLQLTFGVVGVLTLALGLWGPALLLPKAELQSLSPDSINEPSS